jgi:hypothetical protein
VPKNERFALQDPGRSGQNPFECIFSLLVYPGVRATKFIRAKIRADPGKSDPRSFAPLVALVPRPGAISASATQPMTPAVKKSRFRDFIARNITSVPWLVLAGGGFLTFWPPSGPKLSVWKTGVRFVIGAPRPRSKRPSAGSSYNLSH